MNAKRVPAGNPFFKGTTSKIISATGTLGRSRLLALANLLDCQKMIEPKFVLVQLVEPTQADRLGVGPGLTAVIKFLTSDVSREHDRSVVPWARISSWGVQLHQWPYVVRGKRDADLFPGFANHGQKLGLPPLDMSPWKTELVLKGRFGSLDEHHRLLIDNNCKVNDRPGIRQVSPLLGFVVFPLYRKTVKM